VKNFLLASLVGVAVAGTSAVLFREPLLAAAGDAITADMFVAANAATLDIGVPVGEPFPQIRAMHDGHLVESVARFLGPNGLVLVANRSAVW
jgi:hypothetical protein